jgi:hypothetical protein
MVTKSQLIQLLDHRGPVFYVKEEYKRGQTHVCPQCGGRGSYVTTKSDCSYNSWQETVTCHTCGGNGRADRTFSVEEVRVWSFEVSVAGIEPDYFLREKEIFLLQEEAAARALELNEAEKKAQSVSAPTPAKKRAVRKKRSR